MILQAILVMCLQPVVIEAHDNVGVTSVSLYVNRSQGPRLNAIADVAPITWMEPPYRTLWDTRTVPNGQWTLTAVARDAAGNERTATRAVIVRNRLDRNLNADPCVDSSDADADSGAGDDSL